MPGKPAACLPEPRKLRRTCVVGGFLPQALLAGPGIGRILSVDFQHVLELLGLRLPKLPNLIDYAVKVISDTAPRLAAWFSFSSSRSLACSSFFWSQASWLSFFFHAFSACQISNRDIVRRFLQDATLHSLARLCELLSALLLGCGHVQGMLLLLMRLLLLFPGVWTRTLV